MKKDLQFKKWFAIVGTILMLVLGILILVLAITVTDQLSKAISIIIAIGCFIAGLSTVVYGLVKQNDKLVSIGTVAGASLISTGVVLCVNTLLIQDVIVYFIGALLLTIGAINVMQFILQIIKKSGAKKLILTFITLALAIALGVLVIVYSKQDSIKWIYCVMGAVLALSGLVGLIIVISKLTAEKKDKKDVVDNK